MSLTFAQLMRSLRNDRPDPESPSAPDGLSDISSILAPLIKLGANGRALHSNKEYSMAGFIVDLVDHITGTDIETLTPDDLDRTATTLIFVLTLVFRAVEDMHPDTTVEEVVMVAMSQDKMRDLATILTATPFRYAQHDCIDPDVAHLPMFSRATPITDERLAGFVKRHIAPIMQRLTDGPRKANPGDNPDVDEVDEPRAGGTPEVDLSDLSEDEMTADPLNGFDEFDDEFFDNEDLYLDDDDHPDCD